ncbi:MAG: prepilin-type N-terminal cleavage/methylation domain-containing protein [Planctomycetota bacterium]
MNDTQRTNINNVQNDRAFSGSTCRHQGGFSLVEVIAAVIIAATVAAIGVAYLKPAGDRSHQRSCDLVRQTLQNDADRYFQSTGRRVSRNLRQLRSPSFSGNPLPRCPVTDRRYRRNGQGVVYCPVHESTRAK